MSFEKTSFPYYSQFIHKSRYARWRYDLGRRETWEETCQRVVDFWVGRFPWLLEPQDLIPGGVGSFATLMYDHLYELYAMGSMRTMMTAGPALDRDNIASFNCAYEAIKGRGPKLEIMTPEMEDLGFDQPIQIQMKEPIAFDEGFYILLCGTGLGYSVERQYVANLPTVGKPLNRTLYHRTKKNFPGVSKDELSYFDKRKGAVVVADTKYGWASALRIILVELYNGNFDIKWDTSKVRPAGAILKTFGGRASGPGPLEDLFSFTVGLFREANGRKLTSLEAHSLLCKIADVTVVGGVRRSALLSLSNLSDDRMRHAKSGDWWKTDGHYALANNSTAYTEKPGIDMFMREWQALVESKSGERGIFNRQASELIAARNGRRKPYKDYGTNPCLT